MGKHQLNDLIDSLRLRDAFIAGDDGAYACLYDMYSRDLYRFGLSLYVRTELIEDAVHDIFTEIYSRRQILVNVRNLKLYFTVAFRNRLLYLAKKESISADISDRLATLSAGEHHLDELMESESVQEKEQQVKRIMSELNPHQREVIYHRFYEGMALEEIARTMNINYQSAKNLLHRTIKKLNSLCLTILTLIILIQ